MISGTISRVQMQINTTQLRNHTKLSHLLPISLVPHLQLPSYTTVSPLLQTNKQHKMTKRYVIFIPD